MDATDLQRLSDDRGWSRTRLIVELRRAAAGSGQCLPAELSLKRMIRQWVNGERGLSAFYADLFAAVFGVAFDTADTVATAGGEAAAADLLDRLARAGSLDKDLVALFEVQTQQFRLLDRRLGARRLLPQTEAHVNQMSELLAFALTGPRRAGLAQAVAEAAALAGWQALDLGRPDRAWLLHETAKSAARDSGNPSVVAHVTAQQAYSLLDLGRPADAVQQVRYAREAVRGQVPTVVAAWLSAAEGEMLAATGDEAAARDALDDAERQLGQVDNDQLEFLVLDDAHFARWRGHCLARLGAGDAIADLESALAGVDSSFARARASLHCDLATAYAARGERDAALRHATKGRALADVTTSARQQRRLSDLVRTWGAAA